MANLRHPVRIKFIRSLAFSIARHRSTDVLIKPLGKNWPRPLRNAIQNLKQGELRLLTGNVTIVIYMIRSQSGLK